MAILFYPWSHIVINTHLRKLCSMQQQQGFGFCAVQERSCTSGNNASEKVADLFSFLQFNL